jgi:hypothetical protein
MSTVYGDTRKASDITFSMYTSTDGPVNDWPLDTANDAPDGEFVIATSQIDCFSETMAKHVYVSDTKIIVKDGHIDANSACQAVAEIVNRCGYWGTYLEILKFNPRTRTFNVYIGS